MTGPAHHSAMLEVWCDTGTNQQRLALVCQGENMGSVEAAITAAYTPDNAPLEATAGPFRF